MISPITLDVFPLIGYPASLRLISVEGVTFRTSGSLARIVPATARTLPLQAAMMLLRPVAFLAAVMGPIVRRSAFPAVPIGGHRIVSVPEISGDGNSC